MIFLVTFILLFGIKISAFFDVINLLSLILILIFIKRLKITISYYFLLLVLFFAYSAFIFLSHGILDYWHIFSPIKVIMNYIGIYLFLDYLILKKEYTYKHIFESIFYATTLHAIIIIIMYFFIDIRFWIYDITGFIEESPIKVAGLTHGYGNSTIIMIFPLYTMFLFTSLTISRKIIMGMLILLSVFMMGRLGLLLLPFIYILKMIIFKEIFRLTIFKEIFFFLVFIIINILIIKELMIHYNEIALIIKSSFEILFTYIDNGSFSMRSMTTIKITEIEFHNSGVFEYIFGTGEYGRGGYSRYLNTDIAYAHQFSAYGIIGLLLVFMIYLYPLLVKSYGSDTVFLKKVYLLYTISLFIANYKEAMFFTRNMLSISLILAVLIFIYAKKSRNNFMESKH